MIQSIRAFLDARHASKPIVSILFIVVGILLLVFQKDGIAAIALLLGLALLIMAVVQFVQYLRSNQTDRGKLAACIVALIFGVLFLVFRVEVAYYVIPVIVALAVLILAILCLVNAIGYKKLGLPVWWMPLIGAVLAILVAVLIFCNLQGTSSLIAIVIGLFLVIFGILNLLEMGTIVSLRNKF